MPIDAPGVGDAASTRAGKSRLVVSLVILLLLVCFAIAPAPTNASGADRLILTLAEPMPGRVGQDWIDLARPVDPNTLADLPGYPPISLGAHFVSALSPDGQTLAAFVMADPPAPFVGESAGTAMLHLVNLATWRATVLDVQTEEWVAWMDFAPDGRSLYWFAHPGFPGGEVRTPYHTFYRHDLGTQATSVVARLDGPLASDPTPTLHDDGVGGGALALYRIPGDQAGRPTGVPQLLVLDPRTGRTRYDLRLDGVQEGCLPQENGTDRCHFPGLAWDWPRDRLYLAHAEADRVTVVDLARGAILAQRDIAGVTNAPVKVSPWETRERTTGAAGVRGASVGAGGTRLYITGQTIEVEPLPGGGWRERYLFPGLRVVDTAVLAEVDRLALIGSVLPTPDGTRLLVHTARYEQGQPVADPNAFRLTVLDAASLREVGHLNVTPGDIYSRFAASESRYVYLFRPGGGPTAATDPPAAARYDGFTLARFDMETQRVVAERQIENSGRLIGP